VPQISWRTLRDGERTEAFGHRRIPDARSAFLHKPSPLPFDAESRPVTNWCYSISRSRIGTRSRFVCRDARGSPGIPGECVERPADLDARAKGALLKAGRQYGHRGCKLTPCPGDHHHRSPLRPVFRTKSLSIDPVMHVGSIRRRAPMLPQDVRPGSLIAETEDTVDARELLKVLRLLIASGGLPAG
jgi:hypothetical protein